MDGAAADPAIGPTGAAGLAQWLRSRIAARLGISPPSVPLDQPLQDLGLDSKAALELLVELERRLGRALPQTLIWDFPSIARLARHLTDGRPSQNAPDRSAVVEPIAIIGLGLKFPGADSPRAFWRLLAAGGMAISRWPETRGHDAAAWSFPPFGGFLEDVSGFDAAFFGISPREATLMDPQQRLLLEVALRTLEDARLSPGDLAGRDVGTFIGISTSDYAYDQVSRREAVGPYLASGNAKSIAANRLAYHFDLRGPSVAVDTACSSSLLAVHLACESLRSGASDAAFAGGVNVIIRPETMAGLAAAGMLAPDGRCKTFQDTADGYVRAEGCGLVILKRLDDALSQGDPVRAVILGSATNQDGRTNGLNAPSGDAQRRVIRKALATAGVDPASVHAVEAHGTGTQLGDLIEVEALRDCYGGDRKDGAPLWVGSVKAAVGHLEAAAGIAGLAKAILSVSQGRLPGQPAFGTPNPALRLGEEGVQVAQHSVAIQAPARIGVSSFGFGGSNVHCLVEAPPAQALPFDPAGDDGGVLPISFHTPEAGRRWLRALAAWIEDNPDIPARALAGVAAQVQGDRRLRQALIFRDRSELIQALGALAEAPNGATVEELADSDFGLSFRPASAALTAWAAALYETDAAFRTEFLRLEAERTLGLDLLSALYDEALPRESQGLLTCAVQLAYAGLWRMRGLTATHVRSRGAGVWAAAAVAGLITPGEALKLAAEAPDALVAEWDSAWLRVSPDAVSCGEVCAPGLQWLASVWTGDPAPRISLEAGPTEISSLSPATRADGENSDALLQEAAALASIYRAGRTVNWAVVYPEGRRTGPAPPAYPLEAKPLWFPTRPPMAAAGLPGAGQPARTEPTSWSVTWSPVPDTPDLAAPDRSRIIVAGDSLGAGLAAEAGRRGLRAQLVDSSGGGRLDLVDVKNRLSATAGPLELIIVPARSRGEPATDDLAASCAQVAEILRVARAHPSGPIRVRLITRRGAFVAAQDRDIDLAHAAMIGTARALFRDAPEVEGCSLDVGDAEHPEELRGALSAVPPEEWELAIRGSARFARRLSAAPTAGGRFAADPDRLYLITGGLGGVGRLLIDWLASRGARRIVVTGRSAVNGALPPDDADFRRWSELGVEIQARRCDARDPVQMRTLVSSLPDLGGLVHAAGVATPCKLADLSAPHFTDMIGPKYAAAAVLDDLCPEVPLFLLISSISGVWGISDLAAYGAANQLMNAIAERRARRGLTATALALGPVAAGLLHRASDLTDLKRIGLGALEAAQLRAALDTAVAAAEPIRTTLAVDGARYVGAMTSRRADRGLSGLAPASERIASRTPRLGPARGGAEAIVREELAALLGGASDAIDWQAGFFDLGLDSRAMLEFRDRMSERLGLELPPSLAFDHPTLSEIVRFIGETSGSRAAEDRPTHQASH